MNSNWSYSPEMLNSGNNSRFFVPRDLEIWWITLKIIGHLFYITLSFAQHFKAIGILIFKLGLQSGHYDDVIMSAIAAQITSLTIVYSTVYSDADQRKHQSSASLAFVRGIHRGPVNSPHKCKNIGHSPRHRIAHLNIRLFSELSGRLTVWWFIEPVEYSQESKT